MSNRYAVFFHYYEANETYKDNLIFFISASYTESADFFIIISGDCSVELPTRENINYIYAENNNRDFGGYSFALKKIINKDAYDYYIFVNSSTRGPFIPSYVDESWVSVFTKRIQNDIHLVGSSINILGKNDLFGQRFEERWGAKSSSYVGQSYSHVQTTAYALSRTAIKYLISIGFYDTSEKLSREHTITDYEIRLSQEIKLNNWNFSTHLSGYSKIDYRKDVENTNPTALNGDPLLSNSFFGRTLNPFELIFIKSNRGLLLPIELSSHTYTSLVDCNFDWPEKIRLQERSLSAITQIAPKILKNNSRNNNFFRNTAKKIIGRFR